MLTDTEARKIASEWHGGVGTALYAFASTGAIDTARPDHSCAEEIRDELRQNQTEYDRARRTNDEFFDNIDELRDILFYVLHHGTRGPQPGWADLS